MAAPRPFGTIQCPGYNQDLPTFDVRFLLVVRFAVWSVVVHTTCAQQLVMLGLVVVQLICSVILSQSQSSLSKSVLTLTLCGGSHRRPCHCGLKTACVACSSTACAWYCPATVPDSQVALMHGGRTSLFCLMYTEVMAGSLR